MDLAQKPVYKLDLAAGTSVVNLTTPLVEGDDRAQTFTLELTDKGAPANLDGYSVTAYFGRGKTAEAEADTIPLSGTVSGNVATITLTESCYSRSCYFSMPIRLSNGATGQKRTYLIVRGTVVKSVDGTIIDPDGSVPSLDDLFAQIAVMERSRQAAEEATEEALAAAARADEAREAIQGDLAALSKDIARDTAPPIIPTATGEVVTISDSANRPLAGLRLYGKTTQDGTPTPDAPVPLVNVGAGGSIKAYARGKNLLNIAAIVKADERNGVTLTSLGNGFTVQGVATGNIAWDWALDTPIPAGKYVLQAKNIGTSETATLYFANTNGEDVGHLPLSTTYAKNTFTVDVPITRLKLYITSGATVDMRMYPMLSVEDKYDYEEYKDGGFVTANTPNGLPGIPVSSGGNYTDADGQMWLSNVMDYGRGVASQQIGQTVLDSCAYYDTNRNLAYVALSYYPTRNAHLVGLSNGLVYDNLMFDRMVDGTFLLMTTVDDSWGDYLRAVVKLPAGAATNSAEAAAWIKARNITVLYPMYQPIETPIPADELAAFRAMTSQYPHTTVYNDAGAGMQVDYIADTKNYIDNKLAAIAAATL